MATRDAQCAAAQRQWTEPKAPTMRVQKDVVKVSGIAQALRMPPTVMAAMAYIYGSGGYAMNATGAEWMFETPLCRGSIQSIRERSARFRVSNRSVDEEGVEHAIESWPLTGAVRTAAIPRSGSGGSAALESGGFARAGRACAKAQRRDGYLTDVQIAFERADDLARLMTVEQAAEASEMPESLVRHALHRLGIVPSEGERFNGIALRLMLIDYCRQRRKVARSDMAGYAPPLLRDAQAAAAPGWHPEDAPGLVAPDGSVSGATAIIEWERRQMVIQRTEDWRWVR